MSAKESRPRQGGDVTRKARLLRILREVRRCVSEDNHESCVSDLDVAIALAKEE